MNGTSIRRLTLADGLILIAAVAVGLGIARTLQDSDRLAPKQVSAASVFGLNLMPIKWAAMLVTVALIPLRLRRPRAPMRRVRRQPGFIACVAVAFAMAHVILYGAINRSRVCVMAVLRGGHVCRIVEVWNSERRIAFFKFPCRPYLLKKPVTATITEVGLDGSATIDRGSEDGIKEGMRLKAHGRRGDQYPYREVEVVAVDARSSAIRRPEFSDCAWRQQLSYFGDGALILGEKVTSRFLKDVYETGHHWSDGVQ